MVLGIVTSGGVIFQRPTWFLCPGGRGTIVMLLVGLVLGMTVEWVAVHVLQRWASTVKTTPAIRAGSTRPSPLHSCSMRARTCSFWRRLSACSP
jgi:hypothetical protein